MMDAMHSCPADDLLVQRLAVAAEATAHPMCLAAQPHLADALLASIRAGISQEHADWWASTGQVRVTGYLNDRLCSDPAVSMWASAVAMHASIACGLPVDDDHEVDVAEWAMLTVAWDAGRRDQPVHKLLEGDSP